MIELFFDGKNIEASLDITTTLIKINENKEEEILKGLDLYVLMSLFYKEGYSFEAMMRFLFSKLDSKDIEDIKNKKELFNNFKELKKSNDESYLNLINLVYLNIEKAELPKDFNIDKYKDKIFHKIDSSSSNNKTPQKDIEIIDEDLPPIAKLLIGDTE
jgi:hypothetical protein